MDPTTEPRSAHDGSEGLPTGVLLVSGYRVSIVLLAV